MNEETQFLKQHGWKPVPLKPAEVRSVVVWWHPARGHHSQSLAFEMQCFLNHQPTGED